MNLRIAFLALAVLLLTASLAFAVDGPPGALASARDLLHAGRYADATAAAEAIVGSTNDSDVLCGAVDVIIACSLAVGDFDGAAQAAQDLKSRTTDPATLTYLDTQIVDIKAKQAAYERTIAELERTLAAHPYDEVGAEVAYKIGAAKLFRGGLQEALTAYERVASDFPSSDWALRSWLDMAAIQQRLAKPIDAEGLYNQVIAAAPQSAHAARAVAGIKDLVLAQGNPDGAKQRMTDIAARNPGTEASAMAEYCQGELLLVAGKLAEGMAALDKVVSDRAGTVAATSAIARIDAVGRDQLDKAHGFTGARNFDEAVAAYEDVINLAPRSKWVPEARRHLGAIAQMQGRCDDAMAQFKAIIDGYDPGVRDPQIADCRAWALYLSGQLYVFLGDRPKAIGQFERLISEQPDTKPGHFAYLELADACSKIGEYERGIAALQSAIARYPGTETAGGAQWAIGQLLRGQGKDEEAKAAFQLVISQYSGVAGCDVYVKSAQETLAAMASIEARTAPEGGAK